MTRLLGSTVAVALSAIGAGFILSGPERLAAQQGGRAASADLAIAPDVHPSYTEGPHTVAELDDLMAKISNWGRWGKDDQKGAMNLVTEAKRRQAATLVKSGIAVSLAREE